MCYMGGNLLYDIADFFSLLVVNEVGLMLCCVKLLSVTEL